MSTDPTLTVFIGGGNMATAILGGLIQQGTPREDICVIEPNAQQREHLKQAYGIQTQEQASDILAQAKILVWAIKPQIFHEAVQPIKPFLSASSPLHISVAAGIKAQSIASWLGTERIVRVMPNTPALVRQGITGMYAMNAVSQADRQAADTLLQSVGQTVWVEQESQLDGVVAVSGSGPAYAFYLIEAMQQAGQDLGLSAEQSRQLAVATVAGAAALAAQSEDPVSTLRERVTSKGGTTYAALSHMELHHIKQHLIEAMHKAAERSQQLSDEFGK